MTNLETYKQDLKKLILTGHRLLHGLIKDQLPERFEKMCESDPEIAKDAINFRFDYQKWYSESLSVVTQLLPGRINDFQEHYKKPKGRKSIDYESYRIEDALQGLVTSLRGEKIAGPDAAIPHMQQQIAILESVESRFESSLFDIRQMVQADLFDSELESAKALLQNGFLRAAGAVAGVVLEKHLAQVCDNHQLKSRKAHPTISTFNDLLKENSVIDTPTWRQVQLLGDLRNLCDHGKGREPKKEEVEDLISGTEKMTKTLF